MNFFSLVFVFVYLGLGMKFIWRNIKTFLAGWCYSFAVTTVHMVKSLHDVCRDVARNVSTFAYLIAQSPKRLLALVFALLLSLPLCPLVFLLPSFSNQIHVSPDHKNLIGTTTEIYLSRGQLLQSDKPNTLFIEKRSEEREERRDENNVEIGIVLGDGMKMIVRDVVGAGLKPAPTGDDHFITIKYLLNNDRLYFYNHGKKIGSISLQGKKFNVHEMINDLRGKNVTANRRNGEPANGVSYFKTHNTPLSDKRIRLNYERTYPTVKINPPQHDGCKGGPMCPPTSGSDPQIESILKQYTVLTTNLVLNLDASNLNNAGNSADSSDTSTTWTDRSGSGNNGTLTNFTLPTGATASGWDGSNTPANPSVLKFDGVNDYVEVPSFNFTADDLTIALWVKPGSSQETYAQIVDYDHNGGGIEARWVVQQDVSSTNSFYLAYRGTNNTWQGVSIKTQLTANTWQHFVVIKSGTTIRHYLNGVESANGTTAVATILYNTAKKLHFGDYVSGAGRHFSGIAANTRIYNIALTAEQIRQNYLAEAYKFQGTDNVAPGIYGEEDLRTSTYKKSGDTFDVYVEDVNPVSNGDSDVNGINSLTCMLGSTALTTPSATEQNFTGGLTFDGVDDHVITSAASALNITGPISVEALVRPTKFDSYDPIQGTDALNNAGVSYGLERKSPETGIAFWINDGAWKNSRSPSDVSLNQWSHVVGTYDGTNIRVYLNGSQSGSATAAGNPVSMSGGKVAIGANLADANWTTDAGRRWDGQISFVRIYNRALSASEIARNNRARYEPSDPTGLVAWYKLDEGSGTTATARKWDTTTNAIITDATLNGTLTNGPTYTNQYSYNRNKYTFSVPTLTGANQVEKLQCTATDAWSNSTTTNEEVGGVFISKAPTVSTNVTANSTIMTGDTIAVTVLDNTPDTSILSSPTTPTATLDGNAFSTTCNITPTTVSKAETFDGVDDYVSVADSASLDITGAITLSTWIKGTFPGNVGGFITKSTDGNTNNASSNHTYSLHLEGFSFSNGTTTASATYSRFLVNNNQWHHVAGTWDGSLNGSIKVYVDGAEAGSAASTISSIWSTSHNVFINSNSGAKWSGQIDNVQIYNRALSPNEISYLYSNPSKIFNGNGLVGYWRFDQLEDTNSNSVVDNVRDYSSNGNHGTLTNYSALSSALVDSTVTGSIDGRTGSCNTKPRN